MQEVPPDDLFGWKFQIELSAYLRKLKQHIPPEQVNVFSFDDFSANLSKKYKGPIYGIDIDTMYMTYVETGEQIVWSKIESFYQDNYKQEICNNFYFRNYWIGGSAALIGPDIDTLILEFDARFYMGHVKSFYLNDWYAEHGFANDSVAMFDDSYGNIVKRVKLKMIRHDYKTWTPF
jgi:hypothetical protein